MRGSRSAALAMGLLLAGCGSDASPAAPATKGSGRYAGIGVFQTGRLWSQIAGQPDAKDPALARLADDEHIIVVLDSHSGEVRQCGDHSGYCVAMNPWQGAGVALPLKVRRHLEDLDADDATEATNASEPAPASRPVR